MLYLRQHTYRMLSHRCTRKRSVRGRDGGRASHSQRPLLIEPIRDPCLRGKQFSCYKFDFCSFLYALKRRAIVGWAQPLRTLLNRVLEPSKEIESFM